MMQGLLESLAQAKGAIERLGHGGKRPGPSPRHRGWCMAFQDGLDMTQGQIAEDLFALYACYG